MAGQCHSPYAVLNVLFSLCRLLPRSAFLFPLQKVLVYSWDLCHLVYVRTLHCLIKPIKYGNLMMTMTHSTPTEWTTTYGRAIIKSRWPDFAVTKPTPLITLFLKTNRPGECGTMSINRHLYSFLLTISPNTVHTLMSQMQISPYPDFISEKFYSSMNWWLFFWSLCF